MAAKKQSFASLTTPEKNRFMDRNLYGFLGLDPASPHELIGMVNEGLDFAAFEILRDTLGVSAKSLSELMKISARTLHRRRQAGRFDPLESDRLLRISRVYIKAVALFEGKHEAAAEWLHTPSVALGNASPFHYASTEAGALEVEDLIGRLEYGVFT